MNELIITLLVIWISLMLLASMIIFTALVWRTLIDLWKGDF